MARIWKVEEIKYYLENNDNQLCKALVMIYNCQTADEKECHDTNYVNGIGFNGVDAGILSSFAEFYIERGYLSNKQIVICRKKMLKYSRQLTNLLNAKAG